jgi:hypothetical protein
MDLVQRMHAANQADFETRLKSAEKLVRSLQNVQIDKVVAQMIEPPPTFGATLNVPLDTDSPSWEELNERIRTSAAIRESQAEIENQTKLLDLEDRLLDLEIKNRRGAK